MWKPSSPFTTPLKLLIPTEEKVNGVSVKKYPKDGSVFWASFKTYGGTETERNGVIVTVDTATIETTYRPEITAGCRILEPIGGKTYDILGTPENIEMRSQYMKFKIKAIAGGA